MEKIHKGQGMEHTFTEGKILPKLLKFVIPLLLALFLQAMYGAVDLMIVGRFGDATGVSAVATGSQIMQTLVGIISGITTGATVLLGQYIGAKNEKGAGDTVGAAICLFSVVAVIATFLMLCFVHPFVALMHAPEEAFDKTVLYVVICALGTIFITAYNAISSIFRGIGNSKLPLVFVAIACVVNIIGDLLLVGVFKLDASGAAIATVAAQAVSVICSFLIIKKRGLPFLFTRKNIRFHKSIIRKILLLGAPISVQDALTNLSFLIITAILNSMGLVVSAGIGVCDKIVIFIMLVPSSFMTAVSAFVAQNIGAEKPERVKKTLWYGIFSSLCVGVIMFILSFWFGETLAGIFSKETPVILAAADYLKAYAFDCILVCVLFCMMGFYNGCGKTIFVMIQGLVAAFCVRIPFSYFMSKIEGATMFQIGLAAPLATILSILICLIYYKTGKWKQ